MAQGGDSFSRRTAVNLVSGTVAGITACLVGHPFDTLKVRLQTQPTHRPVYAGVVDCFIKTLRWEGAGGLYKGVGAPIVGQMFFRATLFTSYYQVAEILSDPSRPGSRLPASQHYVCGAITGLVASFVEGPIDLFKTKMQIQIIRVKTGAEVQYRHVFHACADITRKYGIRGTYQGLPATILRNVPAYGIALGSYEVIRDYMTPGGGTVADLTNQEQLFAGAATGLLYWLGIYPLDVIKSSMQSDSSERGQRRFRGVADCACKLYSHEGGLRRFFRGFVPCLLRATPVSATMFFALEKCRLFLQ